VEIRKREYTGDRKKNMYTQFFISEPLQFSEKFDFLQYISTDLRIMYICISRATIAVYRVQDNEASDRFDRINNNHILFGSLLNPLLTILYVYKNDGNVIILYGFVIYSLPRTYMYLYYR